MSDVQRIAEFIQKYCKEKGWNTKPTEQTNAIRIDVSNIKERTIINVYNTGTIQVQGAENNLKKEVLAFKSEFDADPEKFVKNLDKGAESCFARYHIIDSNTQQKIKELVVQIAEKNEDCVAEDKTHIIFSVRLIRSNTNIRITQFTNGTLSLQGKKDSLFDDCCEVIEKEGDPITEEVAARFVSQNEENLKSFVNRFTPQVIKEAKDNVLQSIGEAYNYLEEYDKKYIISSECLRLCKIELPEYSGVVMPASKALEGFAQKLLVDIGLYTTGYFNKRDSNFKKLAYKTDSDRKKICDQNNNNDAFLERLNNSIKLYRNFMMHSDGSSDTKVETYDGANEKIRNIYSAINEVYGHFDEVYNLSKG